MNTPLKNKRIDEGKTQQNVSDLANISLKSYQRIEAGRNSPGVLIALRIAEVLKVKSLREFRDLFSTEDR